MAREDLAEGFGGHIFIVFGFFFHAIPNGWQGFRGGVVDDFPWWGPWRSNIILAVAVFGTAPVQQCYRSYSQNMQRVVPETHGLSREKREMSWTACFCCASFRPPLLLKWCFLLLLLFI